MNLVHKSVAFFLPRSNDIRKNYWQSQNSTAMTLLISATGQADKRNSEITLGSEGYILPIRSIQCVILQVME